MRENRLGLEAGLDVAPYAKLIFSGADMKEKQENLLKERTKTYRHGDRLGIDVGFSLKKAFSTFVEENENKVYAFILFIIEDDVTEEEPDQKTSEEKCHLKKHDEKAEAYQ